MIGNALPGRSLEQRRTTPTKAVRHCLGHNPAMLCVCCVLDCPGAPFDQALGPWARPGGGATRKNKASRKSRPGTRPRPRATKDYESGRKSQPWARPKPGASKEDKSGRRGRAATRAGPRATKEDESSRKHRPWTRPGPGATKENESGRKRQPCTRPGPAKNLSPNGLSRWERTRRMNQVENVSLVQGRGRQRA